MAIYKSFSSVIMTDKALQKYQTKKLAEQANCDYHSNGLFH